MSLKELTAHKHREAEQSRFMKALIEKQLPAEVWTEFLFQKWMIYKTLEGLGGAYCGLNQVPEIYRTIKLFDDYRELTQTTAGKFCQSAIEYHHYLTALDKQSDKIMAHIYVWHMGDLFGGQMIKTLVQGSNNHLTFENRDKIIGFIRQHINDSMADEANLAFDYAIKIMNDLF